jgi:hypothetical protein
MPPLMDIVGAHADDLFVRDPFSRMTMLVPGLTETMQGINNSRRTDVPGRVVLDSGAPVEREERIIYEAEPGTGRLVEETECILGEPGE